MKYLRLIGYGFLILFFAVLVALATIFVPELVSTWGGDGLDVDSDNTSVSVPKLLNRTTASDYAKRKTSSKNRDILLVTVDTLRADHLSFMGYPKNTTPFMDTLAGRGVTFTRAFSPTSVTAPAHASILTSLYPLQHRVRKNGQGMNSDITTLQQILRKAGYQTAGAVSTESHFSPSNLSQGFELFDDPESEDKWYRSEMSGGKDYLPYRPAERTVARAEDQLRQVSDTQPLFMWVHFYDPHSPYTKRPNELKSVSLRDDEKRGGWIEYIEQQRGFDLKAGPRRIPAYQLYDSEIRHVDRLLKSFYDTFRRLRDQKPFTVLTADHGEGMGNHGYWAHDMHIYNEQVHVPLILDWPEDTGPNKTIQTAVELTDITPTILHYAGVDSGTLREVRNLPFEGSPLQSLVKNENTGEFGYALMQRRTYEGISFREWFRVRFLQATTDPVNYPFEGRAAANYEVGKRYALTDGTNKYFYQTELYDEYYDLTGNFIERRNLIDKRPGAAEMGSKLYEIIRFFEQKTYPEGFVINETDRKKLEALGYIN
ncbi:MAG: sulfatase [bacterium]